VAISPRAVGAWAASNATTQTVTLPTHVAGDMLIVRAVRKPFTNPNDIVCNTSGWAEVAAGVANGATANGVGVGSMAFKAFWKIATSSSETNPVVTWGTTAAPGAAVAVSYQLGAGESWLTPTGNGGGDATARTSQTSTIASHVSVVAGDMVDFFRAQCDDSGALTAPTITQTGVTYAAVTEYPATALLDGTSNDIAADGGYRLATAGTSSAAAVVTGTSAASEQHGAWMTRLRVFTPELHSGSVTATGGGVSTTTGKKTGLASVTATGGGVSSLSGTKQGRGSATATASGIATVTQSTSRSGSATATGAGIATVTQATARGTSVTASAGGTATTTGVRASSASVAASAGGVASVSGVKAAASSVTATAGGTATIQAISSRSASVSASASGVASVSASSQRLSSVTATGGGASVVSGFRGAASSIQASAGGTATLSGSKQARASVVATGGGTVTIDYEVGFGGVGGQVDATGGGSATVSGSSNRRVAITATGAGTAVLTASSSRYGSVSATGGGSATVLLTLPEPPEALSLIEQWFSPNPPSLAAIRAAVADSGGKYDAVYSRSAFKVKRLVIETVDGVTYVAVTRPLWGPQRRS
jgi:hypothetical protein